MLKLTYSRRRDKFQTVTVLGDVDGIRDLYWQLTYNYKARDGTAIYNIKITNLDGEVCTTMVRAYLYPSQLSSLDE